MDNSDRYSDYVHRLYRISGMPENVTPDILPLRCIPHKNDPRRERSLKLVLDIQFSNEEKPLVVLDNPESIDYQQLLHHVVIPSKRVAPLSDTAHMPNCRDPRRFRACKRRGLLATDIGPPNLVENPEVPAEEETCPVLTIDLADWPKSTDSYIELIPHECNVLRASEFICRPDYNEELVASDNENTNVLLGAKSQCRGNDSLMEIVDDDDVIVVSGYDAGDSSKPMLAIGDCLFNVEEPIKSFLGDDELMPVMKREPTPERPVPRFDASNVDVIDLCDDEDLDTKYVVPKRERSSSVECVSAKSGAVVDVITLDSDDDDDADATATSGEKNRGNAATTPSEIATAEQHVDLTTELSRESEQQSAFDVQRKQSNAIVNVECVDNSDAAANQVLDEDTATFVEEIVPVTKFLDSKKTRNLHRPILDPLRNVINYSDLDEFNEIWDSTKDGRLNVSVTFCAESNEAQTIETGADAVADEPDLSSEHESETRENLDKEPRIDNKTDKRLPRRISIVTSDAFDAQKKLLIDVISNSNDDAETDDDSDELLMSRCNKIVSHAAKPGDALTERLQQVVNEMTCAKYLDRSIFTNSCVTGQTAASSEKRKREEPPENEPFDETPIVEVKRFRNSNKKERPVVDSVPAVPINNTRAPAATSTTVALYQNKSPCLPTTCNAGPVINRNVFSLNQVLLNNLISYIQNYNIVQSSIKFMLHHYGGLSVVTAIKLVNETFWCNRYNHWNNNNDWNGFTKTKSLDLPTSEDSMANLPQDNQLEKQVDASYFLKYPILKSNNLQLKGYEYTWQVKSEVSNESNKKDKPNICDGNISNLKIKKRHSLPMAAVSQHNSHSKRIRSNSCGSWNDNTFNSISPIKLKRDQSNKQNWIALNSKECLRNDNLEKIVDTNIQYTKEKTSCHLIIDVSKIKSCRDKVVPELDNDDYIKEPVNSIDKKSIENNLSTYLKTKLKRQYHVNEAMGVQHSSKRQKLYENSFGIQKNINSKINVNNGINNHLDESKENRRSLDLSESSSDFSKKYLPKNYYNEVSYSNSVIYDKRVDHNSNIFDAQKEQVSSPERYSRFYERKKRRSQEIHERKRRKLGQKYAHFFGDSDSDALENMSSLNNVASTEKTLFNDNRLSIDDGYDSKDNCDKNTIRLDKNDVKPTSLENESANSEVESVSSAAKEHSEMPIDDSEIEQTNYLFISIRENEVSEDSVKNTNSTKESNEDVQVNKSCENSTHLEESSYTLSQTSSKNVEDCVLNTNSLTISEKIKELLDKCVQKAVSEVSSENETPLNIELISEKNSPVLTSKENLLEAAIQDSTLINNGLIDNNGIEEKNMEEGDLDYVILISNSDDEEPQDLNDSNYLTMYSSEESENANSEDLNNSNCMTIHSFGENENANNELLESRKQCLLVSNNSITIIEENNDHCSDKTAEYLDACIVVAPKRTIESSNKKTVIADSKSDNVEQMDICQNTVNPIISNMLTTSEIPLENQVLTSTAASSNLSCPITHNNDEFVNRNNEVSSSGKKNLVSNNDTVESKSLLLPDDFKNPIILKQYNLIIIEESASDDINNQTHEQIDDLQKQEMWDALNSTEKYSKISPSKKISKNENQLTNNLPESSCEEFKNFNIHYIDIDSDEPSYSNSVSRDKCVDNNLSISDALKEQVSSPTKNTSDTCQVSNSSGIKVRNINDLLEKTSPPKNVNSFNEEIQQERQHQTDIHQQTEPSANVNLLNFINSSKFDEYNAVCKSISFALNELIKNMSYSHSGTNISSINPMLQSIGLLNNSQVHIKLASNMFSNEFSTSNQVPTIYDMESPPSDILELLLPEYVKTKIDLDKYKEKLLDKLIHNLDTLQKYFKKDFKKYSTDLISYNILSEKTWKFQKVILTVMQCIGRLIFFATDENKLRIMKIIEKTQRLTDDSKRYLQSVIFLYKLLANQNLCHQHIFLYDPIYADTGCNNNPTSNDLKLTKDQTIILCGQITAYRSFQNLPRLNNL